MHFVAGDGIPRDIFDALAAVLIRYSAVRRREFVDQIPIPALIPGRVQEQLLRDAHLVAEEGRIPDIDSLRVEDEIIPVYQIGINLPVIDRPIRVVDQLVGRLQAGLGDGHQEQGVDDRATIDAGHFQPLGILIEGLHEQLEIEISVWIRRLDTGCREIRYNVGHHDPDRIEDQV